MIKSYLKIAWRNLMRYKNLSLINILGLSIGVATCLLIFFYVEYELGYDHYHSKKDRIIRINAPFKTPDGIIAMATSPALLATELKRSFPEIEMAVRLQQVMPVVKHNNELFREQNYYNVDAEIFSVFDYTIQQGDAASCLRKPNSIVLTEGIAKKYFGRESALGKMLILDDKPWTVTAIIANPPTNSDIKIDALLSTDFSKITEWVYEDFTTYTFALFKGKPLLEQFAKKLADLSQRQIQPEMDKMGAKDYSVQFGLVPLTEVHFSKGMLEDTPKGNKQVSYMFSLLAIFILLIAILNYINLTTARATERAREVGVRKVNGARNMQLIQQFLFEFLLLISAAWILAIIAAFLILPFFNRLLETNIRFSWQHHAGFMLIAFFATVIFSGLYPAFVLTGFKPMEILRGKWRHSNQGVLFRKGLTVVQFVMTACLVTGTIVIYSQMKFIQQKELGFTAEKIININVPRDSIYQRALPAFVQSVTAIAGSGNLSAGNGMRGEGMGMGTTFAETENGSKKELMSIYQFVDKNFIPLFGITIKEGRNLSDSLATDKMEAVLVNEAFVKNMGWKSAIGKSMDGFNKKAKVVGVVKNYYYKSLHNLVEPLIIAYNTFPVSAVSVKTDAKNLSLLTQTWKAHFPSVPFEYSFLDESYAAQYKKDETTQTLFTYFAVLAICISAMGLYGLVSLMAVQRSKEISVRKVLGASLARLVALLSRGSVQLIIIASAIAVPISWYGMSKWLEDYAYHIELSWWMFVLPLALITLIALMVIAKQVVQAAMVNPVGALRTE